MTYRERYDLGPAFAPLVRFIGQGGEVIEKGYVVIPPGRAAFDYYGNKAARARIACLRDAAEEAEVQREIAFMNEGA